MDEKKVVLSVELPRSVEVEMWKRDDGKISVYIGNHSLWSIEGQQIDSLLNAIREAGTPENTLMAIINMVEDAAIDAARNDRA